jgi:glycosyltransferase involved in cell wall biosynthesis
LEEQIFLLAQAFKTEGSLLVPLFLESSFPGRGGDAAFESEGMPVEHLDLTKFRWQSFWKLKAQIERYAIDLIHWHFYPPINSYVLALSALYPRLRHYYTDRISREVSPQGSAGIRRLLKWPFLNRYQKVLCVSQFVKDCLSRTSCWSNVEYCPNFINCDRFRPDPVGRTALRHELNCESQFVVLLVAHLIRQKGADVAIRALAETPSNAVLWVVGDGPELASLQALAASLGLKDRVMFWGQQSHVQRFMQAADCLICPSLWAEAAGFVNLEALGTGLPVLASRIGGIPEYVEDGVTGLLFRPGDYHSLAGLIRRLNKLPEECRQFGAAARKAAIDRFSVTRRLDEYLDHYRRFPAQ